MGDGFIHLAFMGVGGSEFIFIMLVLLMMFGAKDAPRIFRKLNEIFNQMRNTADSFKREIMYGDLNAPKPPRAPDAVEDDDAHYEDYDYSSDYLDEEIQAARDESAASAEVFESLEGDLEQAGNGGGDVSKT